MCGIKLGPRAPNVGCIAPKVWPFKVGATACVLVLVSPFVLLIPILIVAPEAPV